MISNKWLKYFTSNWFETNWPIVCNIMRAAWLMNGHHMANSPTLRENSRLHQFSIHYDQGYTYNLTQFSKDSWWLAIRAWWFVDLKWFLFLKYWLHRYINIQNFLYRIDQGKRWKRCGVLRDKYTREEFTKCLSFEIVRGNFVAVGVMNVLYFSPGFQCRICIFPEALWVLLNTSN